MALLQLLQILDFYKTLIIKDKFNKLSNQSIQESRISEINSNSLELLVLLEQEQLQEVTLIQSKHGFNRRLINNSVIAIVKVIILILPIL